MIVIMVVVFMFLARNQNWSGGDPGSSHGASRSSKSEEGEGQLHLEFLVGYWIRQGIVRKMSVCRVQITFGILPQLSHPNLKAQRVPCRCARIRKEVASSTAKSSAKLGPWAWRVVARGESNDSTYGR